MDRMARNSRYLSSMFNPFSSRTSSSEAVPFCGDHAENESYSRMSQGHPHQQASPIQTHATPAIPNESVPPSNNHNNDLAALPSLSSTGQPPSYREHNTPRALLTQIQTSSQPQPTSSHPISNPPASLTLDRDLIFPSTPPARAAYSLLFALSPQGTQNILRRSLTPSISLDGSHKHGDDKELYTIRRDPVSRSEFDILGHRRSTFSSLHLSLRKHFLGGKYWECAVEKTGEVILKSRGDEWIDSRNLVVAHEPNGILLSRKQRKQLEEMNRRKDEGDNVQWVLPVLELNGEMEERLRDLLVAVWVAKCWFNERVGAMVPPRTREYLTRQYQRRTMLGAGSLFF